MPAPKVNPETGEREKPKRVQGPRPAYILLSAELPEDVEIVGSTRKAEEALEAIDKGTAKAYLRMMIK